MTCTYRTSQRNNISALLLQLFVCLLEKFVLSKVSYSQELVCWPVAYLSYTNIVTFKIIVGSSAVATLHFVLCQCQITRLLLVIDHEYANTTTVTMHIGNRLACWEATINPSRFICQLKILILFAPLNFFINTVIR